MALTLLRYSLLAFILFGWSSLLDRYFPLDRHIRLFFTLSVLTLLLYIGSLLNVLLYTVYILAAVGFVYGILSARQQLYTQSFHWPKFYQWFFMLYATVFVTTLARTPLVHYDNFSHWGTFVKFLFTENRLATPADPLIEFFSYPVGSSLFVYFTTVIAGFSQQTMLIGQFILILSALYTCFAVVKDLNRRLLVSVVFIFFSLFNHFNIAIRMNNLLVDFLLPLIALGGIAGIITLKNQPQKIVLFTAVTAGFLGIIKNSGLFFVALLLLYGLAAIFSQRKVIKWKRTFVYSLIMTAVSFLPFTLWLLHLSRFPAQSKHGVSLDAYQSIFEGKNNAIIQDISRNFLTTLTSLSTPSTQGLILGAMILLLSSFVFSKYTDQPHRLLRTGMLLLGITVLYYLGIYAMFLFSMPIDEALVLAGFERYASSIVIFNLGIILFDLVRTWDAAFYVQEIEARDRTAYKSIYSKNLYQYATVLFTAFAFLGIQSENNGMLYNLSELEALPQGQIASTVDEQFVLSDHAHLIVSTDTEAVDNFLLSVVGRYYLYSPHVTGREDFDMDSDFFERYLSEYDTVVLLEPHFTFQEMIYLQTGKMIEPGHYSVDSLLN